MKITMDDSRITSVSQLEALIKSAEGIALSLEQASVKERYAFPDFIL